MTGKTFTCVACHETVPIGKWLGCFGDAAQEHKVEPKTYYSSHDMLQVHVIPERRITDNEGNLRFIPGVFAGFTGGKYTTDSPAIQHVLDQKTYLQSKDQYVDERLTPKMREARQKGIIIEQAALLEKQKAELEALRGAKAGGGPAVAVEEKPGEDGEPKQEASKRAGRGRG